MRINIYAEEMTDKVEIISKATEDGRFTGLRLYLELPVTAQDPDGTVRQIKGPFIHHPGDDDSSAVTFWGKHDLRDVLRKMLAKLDEHYDKKPPARDNAIGEAAAEAMQELHPGIDLG